MDYLSGDIELLPDQAAEAVFDLVMSRDGGLSTVGGIRI
jgi:hypothetical protein